MSLVYTYSQFTNKQPLTNSKKQKYSQKPPHYLKKPDILPITIEEKP